jgi:hypothetical protein
VRAFREFIKIKKPDLEGQSRAVQL